MNLSRLFRSRWAALLWSAGIVWTAYDVADEAPVPPPPPANASASAAPAAPTEDAAGATFDMHDLAVLANAEN